MVQSKFGSCTGLRSQVKSTWNDDETKKSFMARNLRSFEAKKVLEKSNQAVA